MPATSADRPLILPLQASRRTATNRRWGPKAVVGVPSICWMLRSTSARHNIVFTIVDIVPRTIKRAHKYNLSTQFNGILGFLV